MKCYISAKLLAMKHLLLLFLCTLFLFSCKEESDDSSDPLNSQQGGDPQFRKNQDLQGQLYNQDWHYNSASLKLNFIQGEMQNWSVELFDSTDYDPCHDFFYPGTTARLALDDFPLAIGRYEIIDGTRNFVVDPGRSATAQSNFVYVNNFNYGYLEVTKIDTTIDNYVKFYLSLRLPFSSGQSSDYDYNVIEGWVEGYFCRTGEKHFFKDQPLSGHYDGQGWTFQGGFASFDTNWQETSFALYSSSKDSNCVNFDYNTFPRFSFSTNGLNRELTPGIYDGSNGIDFGSDFRTSITSDPSTDFPMRVAIKVEEVDTVNNRIRGIVDAFSVNTQNSEPIELQGRFEVPYCN